MIRLRKILLCNFVYFFLLFLTLLFTFVQIHIKKVSHYSLESVSFTGIITSIKIEGDLLSLTLQDRQKESVVAYYSFASKKEKNKYQNFFSLGEKLKVEGEFSYIQKSTTNGVFDYQEYASRKKIFYSIQVASIVKLENNKSLLFFLKNNISRYFSTFKNGNYLSLLLLGDKTGVAKEMVSAFRNNGISHLFAISGMHVGILSSFLLKALEKLKVREEKRYFITCFFLFIYLFLTGVTASVLRAFLFFFLFTINKIYYFHIESVFIFILTFCITLFINPYFIYDIGFQYSFLISFTLIVAGNLINLYKNYFIKLFITSFLSFLISIPITTYHFYQINFLAIFYNLFYVPFVTLLLFPFSLLTLIFRPFSFFYDFLIYILEESSLYLNKIDSFCFIFGKVPIFIYCFYFFFFFLFLKCLKKRILLAYFFVLFFHYFYYSIFDTDYLVMFDIGQGDSFLMHSRGKTILIDTGGVPRFVYEKWRVRQKSYLTDYITIPYLKSRGIKKIDYLILTHGDYDHLGEALHLINHYRVGKVFINEGRINSLERQIINTFSNVEVCYQDTYFQVGDFNYLSLNTDLGDENSSSIVLYVTYHNYKMLFMGDANFKSEEYLMKNYHLEQMHLLKLGHHGSKSSSNLKFLEVISPSVALISAGVDNKFKHPNKETLERLEQISCVYYATNELGTVEINFTKNSIEYSIK